MSISLASHFELKHENTFQSARPPAWSSITIDRGRRTTFRISKIPVTVSKKELLSILGTLFPPTSFDRQPTTPGRVLECSVAPSPMESGRYQVATVTFDSIPTQLQSCAGTEEWVSLTTKICSTTIKLAFDSHFIGLTPLQDGNSDSYQFDLFFVTGLAGHAFGSWKARGEHTMWVRDFLAKDLEYKHPGKVRVLTYGYDTKLLESSSTAGVAEFASSLLDSVKNARRSSEEQRRPIIFVAHSLGGLVVKKVLLQAAGGTERDLDVSHSTRACFFLGVPHRGMNTEQLKEMVKGQPNAALISDLEIDSPFLKNLESSFKENFTLDSLRIFSVYETRLSATVQQSSAGIWNRTGPMVEMVSKESALDCLAKDKRHTRIPRNVDHSTLAKFTSNADHDYENLRCHILECVEDASKIVSKDNVSCGEYSYDSALDTSCGPPDFAEVRNRQFNVAWLGHIFQDVLCTMTELEYGTYPAFPAQCIPGDEVPVNNQFSEHFKEKSNTIDLDTPPPRGPTQVGPQEGRWPHTLGRMIPYVRRFLRPLRYRRIARPNETTAEVQTLFSETFTTEPDCKEGKTNGVQTRVVCKSMPRLRQKNVWSMHLRGRKGGIY